MKQKTSPPFLKGRRGRRMKPSLFFTGVANFPMKLFAKFQSSELKTLEILATRKILISINFPPFLGEGGV